MLIFSFLSIFIFILSLKVNGEVIGDFKPGQFWKWKSDVFYEVTSGITDPLHEGIAIVEIADVNNDKSMDLLSISQDGLSFGVHFYIRD